MTDAPEELPIIFRMSGHGADAQVTAVFPTLPADHAGRELTIYAHVGQHGGAGFDWYNRTRAASSGESADLLAELRSIYERSLAPGDPVYRLKVYERMTSAHRQAFRAEAARLQCQLPAGLSSAEARP